MIPARSIPLTLRAPAPTYFDSSGVQTAPTQATGATAPYARAARAAVARTGGNQPAAGTTRRPAQCRASHRRGSTLTFYGTGTIESGTRQTLAVDGACGVSQTFAPTGAWLTVTGSRADGQLEAGAYPNETTGGRRPVAASAPTASRSACAALRMSHACLRLFASSLWPAPTA